MTDNMIQLKVTREISRLIRVRSEKLVLQAVRIAQN